MSYVIAAPEMMAAAATDVAAVGSTLNAAHMAAAAPTVALVPAAADEVSASIARLFSRYAQDFHGLAGQAAAFHEQFVQHLTASARSYAATEAANATSLRPLTASAGSSASYSAALSPQQDQTLILILKLLYPAVFALNQFTNTAQNFIDTIAPPSPSLSTIPSIVNVALSALLIPLNFAIGVWGFLAIFAGLVPVTIGG
jgi:hypothetical protein